MAEGSFAAARHPDPKDLLNLAREQLGRKKSQRIFDHCKECPECADLLLEAVRKHAPAPEKRPLTWWNWASIVLFFVALATVVAALVWFLRTTEQSNPFGLDAPAEGPPSIAPRQDPPYTMGGRSAGPAHNARKRVYIRPLDHYRCLLPRID